MSKNKCGSLQWWIYPSKSMSCNLIWSLITTIITIRDNMTITTDYTFFYHHHFWHLNRHPPSNIFKSFLVVVFSILFIKMKIIWVGLVSMKLTESWNRNIFIIKVTSFPFISINDQLIMRYYYHHSIIIIYKSALQQQVQSRLQFREKDLLEYSL